MSRIGKQPVSLPKTVKATLSGRKLTVTGPNGALARELPPSVQVEINEGQLSVIPDDQSTRSRAMWGLCRSLVQNMVTGVSVGFSRSLEVRGVGYRVSTKDKGWLYLTLGYSHPILYELPEGVSADVDTKANKIVLKGIDKEKVGLAAATIRGFRPPEPYKGKGIRYSDEAVRRKVGKAGGK